SIGFLDNKTVLAHCVWVKDREIDLIAKRGSSVAHCPSSNLKLSSGIAKIVEMVEKGINVAIGTDGAASNNLLNPFIEMRTAILLQQLRRKFLSPMKYVEMATRNGYIAYGIDGGEIEVGRLADIIVFEPKLQNFPLYDYANSLIFSSNGCEVRDVIVDGKVVVEDRQLIYVDEEKVIEKVVDATALLF
ncbi:MAG: amidohydrolase family protein, partial [Archaeoglobaceae archaeon]